MAAQDGLRLDELQALPGVRFAKIEAGTLRVGVQDLATETPRLLQWLVERGHLYRHVASERADLETVFLTLTGRSLRDSDDLLRFERWSAKTSCCSSWTAARC